MHRGNIQESIEIFDEERPRKTSLWGAMRDCCGFFAKKLNHCNDEDLGPDEEYLIELENNAAP